MTEEKDDREAEAGARPDEDAPATDETAAEETPASEPPPEKKKKAPGAKKPAPGPKAAAPKKKTEGPPPPKGRTLWYVALGIVAVAGVTAYQTGKANDEARSRVEAACQKIRPLEDEVIGRRKELVRKFYGEDAAIIERYFDSTRMASVCDSLPAELTGLRWNYGKTWEPPKTQAAKDAPTSEQIHDAMMKAKPRCEKKVTEMLGGLAGPGDTPIPEETVQEALSFCDPEAFSQELQRTAKGDVGWPPMLLEGWPRLLESYAKALQQATEAPVE